MYALGKATARTFSRVLQAILAVFRRMSRSVILETNDTMQSFFPLAKFLVGAQATINAIIKVYAIKIRALKRCDLMHLITMPSISAI